MKELPHLTDRTLAELLYQQAADDEAAISELVYNFREMMAVNVILNDYSSGDYVPTEEFVTTDYPDFDYTCVLPSQLLCRVERHAYRSTTSSGVHCAFFQTIYIGDRSWTITNLSMTGQRINSIYVLTNLDETLFSLDQIKSLTSSTDFKQYLEDRFGERGISFASLADMFTNMQGKAQFIQSACTTFLTDASAKLSDVVAGLQTKGGLALKYLNSVGDRFSGIIAAGGNVLTALLDVRTQYEVVNDTESTNEDYLAHWSSDVHRVDDSPIAILSQSIGTIAQLLGTTLLLAGGVVMKVVGAVMVGMGYLIQAVQNAVGVEPQFTFDAPDNYYCDPVCDVVINRQITNEASQMLRYAKAHGACVYFHPSYSVYLWDVKCISGDLYQLHMRVYLRAFGVGCRESTSHVMWSDGKSWFTRRVIKRGAGQSDVYVGVGWETIADVAYLRFANGTAAHIDDQTQEYAVPATVTYSTSNELEWVNILNPDSGLPSDQVCALAAVSLLASQTTEGLKHMSTVTDEYLQAKSALAGVMRSFRYVMLRSNYFMRVWLVSEHVGHTYGRDEVPAPVLLYFGDGDDTVMRQLMYNKYWSDLANALDPTKTDSLRYFIEHDDFAQNAILYGYGESFNNYDNYVYIPGIPVQYTQKAYLIPPERSKAAVLLAAVIVVAAIAAIAVTAAVAKSVIARKMSVRAALRRSEFHKQWETAVANKDSSAMEKLIKKNNLWNKFYSLFGIGSYDLSNGWVNDPTGGLVSLNNGTTDALTNIASGVGDVSDNVSASTVAVTNLARNLTGTTNR